jgi:hypothetical protein
VLFAFAFVVQCVVVMLCTRCGITHAAIGWNDKSNPFQDKINRKRAGMGDINTAGRVVRGKRAENQ